MRSRSFRIVAGSLAIGLSSFSLAACSKSSSSDTTAAAAKETTAAAAAETTAAAAAATADTTAAAAAASDTTAAAAAAAAAAADTTAAAAAASDTTAAAAAASDTTAAAGAAAASATPTTINAGKDIVYTAVAAGSFLTLAKLLAICGCIDVLHGAGPFTVFAPTDAAFAAVPAATLDALAADKAKLTKVLTYHVVSGLDMAADLKTGDLKTVEGSTLKITTDGAGKITVNDATVAAADVKASNGVIHVIDKVLLPPDL